MYRRSCVSSSSHLMAAMKVFPVSGYYTIFAHTHDVRGAVCCTQSASALRYEWLHACNMHNIRSLHYNILLMLQLRFSSEEMNNVLEVRRRYCWNSTNFENQRSDCNLVFLLPSHFRSTLHARSNQQTKFIAQFSRTRIVHSPKVITILLNNKYRARDYIVLANPNEWRKAKNHILNGHDEWEQACMRPPEREERSQLLVCNEKADKIVDMGITMCTTTWFTLIRPDSSSSNAGRIKCSLSASLCDRDSFSRFSFSPHFWQCDKLSLSFRTI